jgi:glutathione S-transferase
VTLRATGRLSTIAVEFIAIGARFAATDCLITAGARNMSSSPDVRVDRIENPLGNRACVGSESGTIVVGYWDIRGLGSPVRLLLYYLGIDFVDRRYVQGDYDDEVPFSRDAWLSVKHRLGLDLPNLPYLFDAYGENATRPVALTETLPILRHLARTYGKNVSPYALGAGDPYMDMLANIAMELNGAASRAFYGSQSADQVVHAYTETMVPKMVALELYCWRHDVAASAKGADPRFLSVQLTGGAEPSYTDLFLAELLDLIETCLPGSLKAFPHLMQLRQNCFGLERVRAFLSSPSRAGLACNNKIAFVGSGSRMPPPGKLRELRLPAEAVAAASDALILSKDRIER